MNYFMTKQKKTKSNLLFLLLLRDTLAMPFEFFFHFLVFSPVFRNAKQKKSAILTHISLHERYPCNFRVIQAYFP